MRENKKEKVLVVLGPTASGKTTLSVELAKKFNGEIISADSRQVYRGLDIGTEKITKEEMAGISHHLIDVCDPEEIFSVQEFKDKASEAVLEIVGRGHLPIVAGGTGFYIDALLYDIPFPEVAPDPKLREKLEQETNEELFARIEKKDPERANAIDPNNTRRLIRALEVIETLGSVPPLKEKVHRYNSFIVGIETPDAVLKEKIGKRLDDALLNGLVQETIALLGTGVPPERMREFGLEYRIALDVIEGTLPGAQMRERMLRELWRYVRRQRTWFRRNKEIRWFSLLQKPEMEKLIQEFLKK